MSLLQGEDGIVDWVRIHRLELDCIVGLYPYERLREQPILLDVEMQVDTRRAARTGRIAHTVAYDWVAAQLVELLKFRRYRLIEMAAEELCALLLGVHPLVQMVRLTIEKPGALRGLARSASVQVQRQRSDLALRVTEHSWGRQWLLLETRGAKLSRLEVDPGGCFEAPMARADRCSTWLVSSVLRDNDSELRPGVGPRGAETIKTPWSNTTGERLALVHCCVNEPHP